MPTSKKTVSKKKNSLVNNINKRKAAGKSRPKSKSTVSKASYNEMEKGWPKRKKATTKSARSKPKKQASTSSK